MLVDKLLPIYGNLGVSLVGSSWRMRGWAMMGGLGGAWMVWPAIPNDGKVWIKEQLPFFSTAQQ